MSGTNKGSTKVKCLVCGWGGIQGDCKFGHDDFYCPQCGKEALETVEPVTLGGKG